MDRFATNHHGLITRDHSGLSEGAWHRAIKAGHLERVHPGVARLPGTARTPEQRIAAAVLAAGPGALASHRSAARLWGEDRPGDDPVDLILEKRSRGRHLEGVVIHRPRDREHLGPARRSGIRCTNPLRTLIDLGAVAPDAVSDLVGRFLGDKTLSLPTIDAVLDAHGRRGRAGVTALRDAVEEWELDGKPADSRLEAAMRRLQQRFGLPPMAFHPIIEGWEVDFVIEGTPLVIECDRWTSHGLDRSQFENDRDKDDDLRGAGWIVMRLTYRAIRRRQADTARRIGRAIDRWSVLGVPT